MVRTQKQKIGKLGENISCKFLLKQNYKIKGQNYRKKWGEIDIIAEKDNILHFIEVKTVSHETGYKPEENIHLWKKKRLSRAIQTYLLENPDYEEQEWQIDTMAVFLDFKTKKAKIRMIKNVIL
ncbi:MAG: YraN family protein [Patescibacteria group bacterium]